MGTRAFFITAKAEGGDEYADPDGVGAALKDEARSCSIISIAAVAVVVVVVVVVIIVAVC